MNWYRGYIVDAENHENIRVQDVQAEDENTARREITEGLASGEALSAVVGIQP